MPVSFQRSGENIKPVFRCEGCGAYAGVNEDGDLARAIDKRDPKIAGKWWCGYDKATGRMFCKAAEANDLFNAA